jgi:hypothetical protein
LINCVTPSTQLGQTGLFTGVTLIAIRIAALAGAAALIAGCGSSGGNDDSKSVDYNGYNREYHTEARKLTLPSIYGWPKDAVGPKTNAMYEVGSGMSHADYYWFCAWERRWLAHLDSPSLARADLAMLNRIKTLHEYRVASPPADQRFIDNMLDRAELGDPSSIQRDVRVNCPAPVLRGRP